MYRRLSEFKYFRCLLTPVTTLVFLFVQPQAWWSISGFFAVLFISDWMASQRPSETCQPIANAPAWPFRLVLYLLFFVHWVSLILALDLVREIGWQNKTTITALMLLILSSGTVGIAAHELIHRSSRLQLWMGRLLFVSFLLEHFCWTHLHRHHAVTSHRDPALALSNERFWPYFWRNLGGQFSDAYRIERERGVRSRHAILYLAKNRVIQGLFMEAGLVAIVFVAFGWPGTLMLGLNAMGVTLLLQALNYVQHWGSNSGTKMARVHTWDCANQSNLYSMIGMARHADHHCHPERPYHLLEYNEASPKLPGTYGTMLWLAVINNQKFQQLMKDALRSRGLWTNTAEKTNRGEIPSITGKMLDSTELVSTWQKSKK